LAVFAAFLPMWTAAGRGGDDRAHRESETAWHRRQRPENEVPISVAIDAVLADGQEVVVLISGARVFSNGVDFTLEVRARHGTNNGRGGMLRGVHGDGTRAIACCLVSNSPMGADAPISAHRSPPTLMTPPIVRC